MYLFNLRYITCGIDAIIRYTTSSLLQVYLHAEGMVFLLLTGVCCGLLLEVDAAQLRLRQVSL